MPGTMSLEDLTADLKASLHDTAGVFDSDGDATLKRFLAQALPDFVYKRPVTQLGSVTLVAGTPSYSLAAYPTFAALKTYLWGDDRAMPRPWEATYPGALPRVCAERDAAAAWFLSLTPAPSALHLAALGASFSFWFYGQHVLGLDAVDTTVAAADRGLLLQRAQVEAMRELMVRNSAKPVQLRDGLSGTPRNSTPAALFELLLRHFREAR